MANAERSRSKKQPDPLPPAFEYKSDAGEETHADLAEPMVAHELNVEQFAEPVAEITDEPIDGSTFEHSHRDCVACGTGTTDTHPYHAGDHASRYRQPQVVFGDKEVEAIPVPSSGFYGSFTFFSENGDVPGTEVKVTGPAKVVLAVIEHAASVVNEEVRGESSEG